MVEVRIACIDVCK